MTTSSAVRQFFRTPKGLLTIVLVILLLCAAPAEGIRLVAPDLAAAVIVAALLDTVLLRWFRGEWQFPSGAILTGLIVAMILSPREPWYVPACTSAIAVVSKYVARTRSANVFNPAAARAGRNVLHVSYRSELVGGLAEHSPARPYCCSSRRVSSSPIASTKLPLVLVFLGAYFVLFTFTAYLGDSAKVAEVFRAPDLHASLFFAFFILTDPAHCPREVPRSAHLWRDRRAGRLSGL